MRILISKKIAKLATRRNRLRRLLKEALRLEFRLEKGKFYTFRAAKDPGEIGLKETKEALHAIWPV